MVIDDHNKNLGEIEMRKEMIEKVGLIREEMIDYVLNYYGRGSSSGDRLEGGPFKREEVIEGIIKAQAILRIRERDPEEIYGDSMMREWIRELVFEKRRLDFEKEMEIGYYLK